MLITCRCELLLISSTIAASVVLLPDPVGPVTRTRPLASWVSRFTAGGRFSSSSVGTLFGMTRNTAPRPCDWTKMFTRKRATPSME